MRLLIILLLGCSTLTAIEMRFYVLGMLYRGPKASAEVTEESRRLQAGHMANIQENGRRRSLIDRWSDGQQG